jgi:hypothetical protein
MKKLLILGLTAMMAFSTGCNRDDHDIQREEEYGEDDLRPGSLPTNIDDGTVSEE